MCESLLPLKIFVYLHYLACQLNSTWFWVILGTFLFLLRDIPDANTKFWVVQKILHRLSLGVALELHSRKSRLAAWPKFQKNERSILEVPPPKKIRRTRIPSISTNTQNQNIWSGASCPQDQSVPRNFLPFRLNRKIREVAAGWKFLYTLFLVYGFVIFLVYGENFFYTLIPRLWFLYFTCLRKKIMMIEKIKHWF